MKPLFLFTLLLVSCTVSAQEYKKGLKVYYDCTNYGGNCFFDYVRQELSPITFVRDRMDADVHIFTKANWNDNGTQINTFIYLGHRDFANKNDTTKFTIPSSSTEDEIRKILVHELTIGLYPYLSKTNLIDQFPITVVKNDNKTADTSKEKDPYNYWVFQIGMNGNVNANQIIREMSMNGYLNANRETNTKKISANFSFDEQLNRYKNDSDYINYKFKNFNVSLSYAYKIKEHFAIGIETGFANSLYSNLKSQIAIGPAMEYSIFPYKKFNSKRWIVKYGIDFKRNIYYDTTIDFKLNQNVFGQNLSSIFSFTQPWGSINLGAFWRNLFYDWGKNSLSFNGAISTKITKGLTFAFWGNYNFVRNQINIRKGDASYDQILIKNRELLSAYNYSIGIGISYRFGSKFNDVINPIFNGMNYSINL